MPRCKHCKKKFEPMHFNQKYCMETECLKVWVEKVKEVQWKKRKRRLKEELKTTSDYIKEAQKWVNRFVRFRDKDKPCVSCGSALTGKYDAGHFFSAGGHASTRFDPRNIHGQCVFCNQYEHGALYKYQKELINRIGQDEFNDLELKSKKISKWDKENLKKIIKDYKEKCKEIEKYVDN